MLVNESLILTRLENECDKTSEKCSPRNPALNVGNLPNPCIRFLDAWSVLDEANLSNYFFRTKIIEGLGLNDSNVSTKLSVLTRHRLVADK